MKGEVKASRGGPAARSVCARCSGALARVGVSPHCESGDPPVPAARSRAGTALQRPAPVQRSRAGGGREGSGSIPVRPQRVPRAAQAELVPLVPGRSFSAIPLKRKAPAPTPPSTAFVSAGRLYSTPERFWVK